jgi:hypothetical protein
MEETLQNLRKERDRYRSAYNMFYFLTRQEVFISDEEGMKYLTGEDLAGYCHERLIKQDEERHAGYETINLDFKTFANQAITEIIRDEVDKMGGAQLDAYKYITKGRYDTRSQSKKEGS